MARDVVLDAHVVVRAGRVEEAAGRLGREIVQRHDLDAAVRLLVEVRAVIEARPDVVVLRRRVARAVAILIDDEVAAARLDVEVVRHAEVGIAEDQRLVLRNAGRARADDRGGIGDRAIRHAIHFAEVVVAVGARRRRVLARVRAAEAHFAKRDLLLIDRHVFRTVVRSELQGRSSSAQIDGRGTGDFHPRATTELVALTDVGVATVAADAQTEEAAGVERRRGEARDRRRAWYPRRRRDELDNRTAGIADAAGARAVLIGLVHHPVRQDAEAFEGKRAERGQRLHERRLGSRAKAARIDGHAGGGERIENFEGARSRAVLFTGDDRAPGRDANRIAARHAARDDVLGDAGREVDALDRILARALLVAADDVRRVRRRIERHLIEGRREIRRGADHADRQARRDG